DDVHDYQEEEEDYVNDDGDPADEFDFNEDARFSFADNHFDEDIKYNAPELHEKYKVVVGKVRTIVRFFKRSPVKNDLLQSYVKAECSKERKLLLDCKTRWSSLSDMLDTFYELRKPVKKALVDLDGGDKLDLDEMEMELMLTRLEPIENDVECEQSTQEVAQTTSSHQQKNKKRSRLELHKELDSAIEKAMSTNF
ncbi:hypothetical protein Bhyg_01811, partial [Pseudolycoriella hygida]